MRPYVVCLMESSVDGRLHPSRWTSSPDGTPKQWSALYAATHETLQVDGWIVGRVTMAEMAKGVSHAPQNAPAQPRPHHLAAGHKKPYAVAIDVGGKLHFARSDVGGDHVIVLLGSGVPDSHLAELKGNGISYVVAQGPEIELTTALETLRSEFAIERLALEGGGMINGSFLAARLVDELIVIIGPGVDGRSDSPSIVEAGDTGLRGRIKLSLRNCEALEHGAVRLTYAVTPDND